MEVYFKKLTDDLLEVCRMLDDKPEAKNRLSEITVDVSLLPDVGYAYGEWTTTPPTEPGMYRAIAKDGDDSWVHVIAWQYQGGQKFGVYEKGSDYLAAIDAFTHWLGPIPTPEPPKKGSE